MKVGLISSKVKNTPEPEIRLSTKHSSLLLFISVTVWLIFNSSVLKLVRHDDKVPRQREITTASYWKAAFFFSGLCTAIFLIHY